MHPVQSIQKIQYVFITDNIHRGRMHVSHCPTDHMVTDVFSKPLQGTTFRKFCNLIIMNHDDGICNESCDTCASHPVCTGVCWIIGSGSESGSTCNACFTCRDHDADDDAFASGRKAMNGSSSRTSIGEHTVGHRPPRTPPCGKTL